MKPRADHNEDQPKGLAPMDLRKITDWTLVTGANIEIRQHGSHICSGHVDAVPLDMKKSTRRDVLL